MNEFYSVKEIATMLSVNIETVRRWIRRNELRADDIGGNVGYRVTSEQLNDFLKIHKKWERSMNLLSDSKNLSKAKRDLNLSDLTKMGFGETLKNLFASNDEENLKWKKIEIITRKNELIQNKNKLLSTINMLEDQLLQTETQILELTYLEEAWGKEE